MILFIVRFTIWEAHEMIQKEDSPDLTLFTTRALMRVRQLARLTLS